MGVSRLSADIICSYLPRQRPAFTTESVRFKRVLNGQKHCFDHSPYITYFNKRFPGSHLFVSNVKYILHEFTICIRDQTLARLTLLEATSRRRAQLSEPATRVAIETISTGRLLTHKHARWLHSNQNQPKFFVWAGFKNQVVGRCSAVSHDVTSH
jgi:hypothetical protein